MLNGVWPMNLVEFKNLWLSHKGQFCCGTTWLLTRSQHMCTTFQTVGNFLAGDLHLKKKKKMNESPDFFFWSSLHIAFLSTHPYKYASVQTGYWITSVFRKKSTGINSTRICYQCAKSAIVCIKQWLGILAILLSMIGLGVLHLFFFLMCTNFILCAIIGSEFSIDCVLYCQPVTCFGEL